MERSSTSVRDLAVIRQLLNQDPIWAAYALADLQPAFAPHCRWYTGDDAVLLLFHALTPPILLTVGAPTAIAALLMEADQTAAGLPKQVFISALPEHLPLLQRYYDFTQPDGNTALQQMMRMAFRHAEALTAVSTTAAARLQPVDAPRIEQLLQHGGPFTPDAFDAYQLDEGVFFGLNDETGKLLAVGGTHIVDWHEGVGAIGNMYTHPAQRGKGYARLILGAIVKTLQQGGIHNIVLNVNRKNSTAMRIYEQYGFVGHCPFVEGIGVKRQRQGTVASDGV